MTHKWSRCRFPGKYRVESVAPVRVDGVVRGPGEVFDVAGGSVQLARETDAVAGASEVRLLTAEARPPPAEPPEFPYIFTGL